jgi:hypothetical protein
MIAAITVCVTQSVLCLEARHGYSKLLSSGRASEADLQQITAVDLPVALLLHDNATAELSLTPTVV